MIMLENIFSHGLQTRVYKEYSVVHVETIEELEFKLNQMGDLAWELKQLLTNHSGYLLIFERPKKPG